MLPSGGSPRHGQSRSRSATGVNLRSNDYLSKQGILTANATTPSIISLFNLSSRMDLKKNADGTVDLYVGPKALAGWESNWVESVPGRSCFS